VKRFIHSSLFKILKKVFGMNGNQNDFDLDIQEMSSKQLKNEIREQKDVISIFDDLIQKHQKILEKLHDENSDSSRDPQIQTHQEFIEGYEEVRQKHLDFLDELKREVATREGSSSVNSVHEFAFCPSEISNVFFCLLESFPKVFILWHFYKILKSYGLIFKFYLSFHHFSEKFKRFI